jgi:hypothetical protein
VVTLGKAAMSRYTGKRGRMHDADETERIRGTLCSVATTTEIEGDVEPSAKYHRDPKLHWRLLSRCDPRVLLVVGRLANLAPDLEPFLVTSDGHLNECGIQHLAHQLLERRRSQFNILEVLLRILMLCREEGRAPVVHREGCTVDTTGTRGTTGTVDTTGTECTGDQECASVAGADTLDMDLMTL